MGVSIVMYLSMPASSIREMVRSWTKWLARNLGAKVTVTVYYSKSRHYCEEYDYRSDIKKSDDTKP